MQAVFKMFYIPVGSGTTAQCEPFNLADQKYLYLLLKVEFWDMRSYVELINLLRHNNNNKVIYIAP